MSAKPKDGVAQQLRRRAATARRLAAQLTQAADREELLQFAAELEAKAERLESRPKPDAKD